MAKESKRSKRYTDAQRARILNAIDAKGLSVAAAAKRYKVSEPTLYLWRKAANGTMAKASRRNDGDPAAMRAWIRDRVRTAAAQAISRELGAVRG